jgi:hypothetical protein
MLPKNVDKRSMMRDLRNALLVAQKIAMRSAEQGAQIKEEKANGGIFVRRDHAHGCGHGDASHQEKAKCRGSARRLVKLGTFALRK